MPAILTSDFSVVNAETFTSELCLGRSNVYMAVGRPDEWTNDFIPPTPVDTIEQLKDMRNRIIGIKRVTPANIMLVVPRIEWQEGKIFKPIQESIVAGKRATDYFCINKNNEVYQCMKAPADNAPTQAGCEPQSHSKDFDTFDGYGWRYLYNITAQMVNAGMLMDNWMPVPFNKHGAYPGGTITESQYLYGDVNANKTLGAYRTLISVTLKDEGEKIPYTAVFRQVSLLFDPKDTKGNLLQGTTYAKSEFDNFSGELIYFENRKPIMREEAQTETLQLICAF